MYNAKTLMNSGDLKKHEDFKALGLRNSINGGILSPTGLI